MEELKLGPNGSLIYCIDFLSTNISWLTDKLELIKDKILLVDLPG